MGKHQTREYALYKGENFIDIGKVGELSKRYGISINTLYWCAACNRWKNRSHKGGIIVVPLEDDEDDE